MVVHVIMKSLDPAWSAKIDTAGRPRDPLGSDRARNRSVRLFAHGLLTNNTLRLRYLSLFSWMLSEFSEREERIEDSDLPRDAYIKNFEKLFALSSQFHRHDQGQEYEKVRGITGVSRLGDYESPDDFENIHLGDIELQKNDGYGYEEYEGVMQNFFLKRGGYDLTTAGESLAEATRIAVAPAGDDIFRIIEEEEVTREQFEDLAPDLAIQAIFTDRTRFGQERAALQRILFGHVTWRGNPVDGTVALNDGDDTRSLNVLETLRGVQEAYEADDSELSETPIENQLHENFSQGVHEFRQAFAYFMLRAWRLYEPTGSRIRLTDRDRTVFASFRKLMRVYWLQVYAGYALEAQLEAMTTFINKKHPPVHDCEDLLDKLVTPSVRVAAGDAITTIDSTVTEDPAGGQRFTRNLLLYGSASGTILEATVNSGTTSEFKNIGDVNSHLSSVVADGYQLEGVNEVLLAKAIRSALNNLDNADPDAAINHWQTAVGRSIALLLLVLQRYRYLGDNYPALHRYMKRQLWTQPGNSVPLLDRYVLQKDSEMPIAKFGRDLLQERVIDLHTKVMYDRLTPGNLQRLLSLDRDDAICLRMDTKPNQRPFTANPRFVRFNETNTFLRDAGFLRRIETDYYEVTASGKEWLQRLLGSESA